MTIFALSDTHMAHERALIPACDVLIHGGDFSKRGMRAELEKFVAWFAAQPARHRVFIAGNHDFICQQEPQLPYELARRAGVTYLRDESYDADGVHIWGSPWTPSFGSGAFQRERGADVASVWAKISVASPRLRPHPRSPRFRSEQSDPP